MFHLSNKATTAKEVINAQAEPRKNELQQVYDFIAPYFGGQNSGVYAGIIGFGKFHYKSPRSGKEGEWYVAGLASHKTGISVYICGFEDGMLLPEKYAAKLKASVGKSCIRYKKFEDIDFEILGRLLEKAVKAPGFPI